MAQPAEVDRELVLRARSGAREAFEELMRRHSALVAAVASAHVSGQAEVEDVFQETFLNAWRELPGLRRPEAFGPWIAAIARNAAISAATAERARRQLPENLASESTRGPAQGRDRDALYRQVLSEVEGLPDGTREIFLLRYVEGKSCTEISEELDMPIGTVTSRLSRGHELLRERLKKATGR